MTIKTIQEEGSFTEDSQTESKQTESKLENGILESKISFYPEKKLKKQKTERTNGYSDKIQDTKYIQQSSINMPSLVLQESLQTESPVAQTRKSVLLTYSSMKPKRSNTRGTNKPSKEEKSQDKSLEEMAIMMQMTEERDYILKENGREDNGRPKTGKKDSLGYGKHLIVLNKDYLKTKKLRRVCSLKVRKKLNQNLDLLGETFKPVETEGNKPPSKEKYDAEIPKAKKKPEKIKINVKKLKFGSGKASGKGSVGISFRESVQVKKESSSVKRKIKYVFKRPEKRGSKATFFVALGEKARSGMNTKRSADKGQLPPIRSDPNTERKHLL